MVQFHIYMDEFSLETDINRVKELILEKDSNPDPKTARHLTTLSCHLLYNNDGSSKSILTDEVETVNRYRNKRNNDFPEDEHEQVFTLSVAIWQESISRYHSRDHKIKGLNLAKSYIQSTDAELAVRYLNLFEEKFVEPIYSATEIQDDDIESIRSNYTDEEFRDRVLYGVVLILLWHKVHGILPDTSSSNETDRYILN